MHVTKPILISILKDLIIRSSVLFCLWALFSFNNAEAAIYACPTSDGDVAYQDRPCEKKSSASERANKDDSESPYSNSEYPLGMHPSWFVSPALAPQPAYCDRLGCDCATLARNFRQGLGKAVADALFLEAAWHRYSASVVKMETDPPRGLAYLELQVEIEDSACEIQMSQITLKNYAERAVNKLEANAELAKLRGHTDYEKCDAGDDLACEDIDALKLFERVQLDLDTLRVPRNLFFANAESR